MQRPTIAQHFVLRLIRSYQRLWASWQPPCCRFVPSCSWYALEAIEKYGVMKGLRLTGTRLLRCQPLGRGGIDPVPEDA